jgi:hypothetical protein
MSDYVYVIQKIPDWTLNALESEARRARDESYHKPGTTVALVMRKNGDVGYELVQK